MDSTVGIGVVGAGAIGIRGALMHLTQPDVQDRVRVTAVCDPAPGRAEAAAAKYGVPAHYLTYEELLADPNVDAVTLCSPDRPALRAGTPGHRGRQAPARQQDNDDNRGRGRLLIEAAAAAGVHIVASPGMMLYPHNRRVRKAVLEGKLGRLVWAVTGTSGVGNYHMNEEFRTGDDVLTDVDPSWYFRKPGGGPQYDVTVYCLHNLTGILGPAKRVTAMSGLVIPERDYHGKTITCDMDDNTVLLLDFSDALYAFVYATPTGSLTQGFQPNIYGTSGAIVGTKLGDIDLKLPDDYSPHVSGPHTQMKEYHVFEDMMQLVDWIRDGIPSVATPEHARHVIDIIESGYRAAETGETQALRTTFEPLSAEELDV